MVKVKINTVSLAVLLCFYTIFVFSINPSVDEFDGLSLEVTDQNQEGVFSSLSRNFEQTIEEINTGDEKGGPSNADEKSTSSASAGSSGNADEKSTTSDVPSATTESSNLIDNNSTTNDNLGKTNQTDFDNQN